jgi:hypothetical protein
MNSPVGAAIGRQGRRFPQRHRRGRKNGTWTDPQLKAALAVVDDGKSMKKAAEGQMHTP